MHLTRRERGGSTDFMTSVDHRRGEDEFDPGVLFVRPDLYLLEFAGPNAILVRMTRDTFRRSIFTDRQRIVAASPEAIPVSTAGLTEMFESQRLPQPQLGYIFHVAHCGSTLLARALEEAAGLLVYREPAPLRQLAVEYVASMNEPPPEAMWSRRLQLVTALLGRSYDDDALTLVKANVPVNFIIPQLMELNAESRGILLYATLGNYLLSVLKSPQHRRWVTYVVRELAAGIRRVSQLADVEPHSLTPATAAACLWLAQTLTYASLADSSDRFRTLDCEMFFEQPADCLQAALGFYGVDAAADRVRAVVTGDLFTHHAKAPDVEFDNAARKAELEKLSASLGTDIDEGRQWVRDRMAGADIPAALPNPLLD